MTPLTITSMKQGLTYDAAASLSAFAVIERIALYSRLLRGRLSPVDWIGRWGSWNIWLQMHRLDQSDMGDDA
jgi:hypothetical protein